MKKAAAKMTCRQEVADGSQNVLGPHVVFFVRSVSGR